LQQTTCKGYGLEALDIDSCHLCVVPSPIIPEAKNGRMLQAPAMDKESSGNVEEETNSMKTLILGYYIHNADSQFLLSLG